MISPISATRKFTTRRARSVRVVASIGGATAGSDTRTAGADVLGARGRAGTACTPVMLTPGFLATGCSEDPSGKVDPREDTGDETNRLQSATQAAGTVAHEELVAALNTQLVH